MGAWSQLLDDYEATIRSLEAAVASGEPPAATAWEPPAVPPGGLPTIAELDRFRSLRERDAGSAARIQSALAGAARAIHDLERTEAAARAYGQADPLIGRAGQDP